MAKYFAKIKKINKISNKRTESSTKILGIEFGNEKCAMLTMNKGKTETTKGIELSNQETITTKWMITNTSEFWKEGKSSRRKSAQNTSELQ